MDDFIVHRKKRKGIIELQIAPVLDMLVAVIFFLLLSTTFVEFTKQSIPPMVISSVTDPKKTEVVAPKVLAMRDATSLTVMLTWGGAAPGKYVRVLPSKEEKTPSADVIRILDQMIKDFQIIYPNETTVQVGFNEVATMQDVLSVMDAVAARLPDIALISYQDTASELIRVGP